MRLIWPQDCSTLASSASTTGGARRPALDLDGLHRRHRPQSCPSTRSSIRQRLIQRPGRIYSRRRLVAAIKDRLAATAPLDATFWTDVDVVRNINRVLPQTHELNQGGHPR